MSAELTKVDSAVAGLSPKDEKAPDKGAKKTHKRTSSSEGVWNVKDLGESSPLICESHALTG